MIAKFKSIFTKSSVGKGAAYLMGASMLGHLLAVITFPVLSRIYSPHDIGIWGMFSSIIALLVVSVNLKYEMAIVTEDDDQQADNLFWFSVIIGVPIALLFTVLFALLIHFHVLAYQEFSHQSIFVLLFAALVIALFQPVWNYYLRHSKYQQLAVTHLSQKVGRLGSQIGLGYILPGFYGLLFSEALGRLLAITYALPAIYKSLLRSLKKITWSEMVLLLKKRIDFPKYILPATIISVLASISAVPLISYFYSAAIAGLYAIVYKILSLPVAILSNTMSDVFYNEAAKQQRDDGAKVFTLFMDTAKKIALFAIVPLIVIELLSPYFFTLFLGKTWQDCGRIAQVLAPWLFTFTIVNSVNRVAIVIKKQWAKLAYDICNFLAVCFGIILGFEFSFNIVSTLALMSMLCASVNLVFFVLFYSLVKQHSLIEVRDDYSISYLNN